jgi:hypothetical protein
MDSKELGRKALRGEYKKPPVESKIDTKDLGRAALRGETPGFLDKIPLNSVFTPEYFADQPDAASFWTLLQSGIVDDPEIKKRIYAQARFPNLPVEEAVSRYGSHGGEYVYLDDDGTLKRETPNKFFSKAKRLAATTGAHAPAMIMGMIGAAAGPWTAALGAAGGEAWRKNIGMMLGERPTVYSAKDLGMAKLTPTDYGVPATIPGIGAEAATGYLGEKAGMAGVHMIDRIKGKQGARILRAAGRGRERISLPEVQRIEQMGKDRGIRLIPPQTTKSPELVSRFNILGDLPETADKIGAFRRQQYEEISTAINDYVNSLAPATVTPGDAGRRAVQASQDAVKWARRARTARARPAYRDAMEAGEGGVDISGTVAQIDDMMTDSVKGTSEYRSLKKIRKMLVPQEIEGEEILEDRLVKIDKIKKNMNAMWKKDWKNAPEIDEQRAINRVLDDMLESVDEQIPDYARARAIHKEMSPDVDAVKQSVVGQIAKTEDYANNIDRVVDKIFSPRSSSPEVVDIAKLHIVRHGGQDAWNALLRTYTQQTLDKISQTVTGGITNIGGRFRKALFGNAQQRKIMKAAMTQEQYQNFSNFMEVLDRTGLVLGKESTTATRLDQLGRMKQEARIPLVSSVWRTAAMPLRTPAKHVYDVFHETLFHKRNEMLADAMLSPRAARQIREMLKLKPGSIQLVKQATTFLALAGKGALSGEAPADEMPEIIEKYKRVNELPLAIGMKGAVFRNTETGEYFESDGRVWKPKGKFSIVKPKLRAKDEKKKY